MHPLISSAFNDFSRGDYNKALDAVLLYLNGSPDDIEANMLLAAIYATRKDYNKVIDVCKSVLKHDASNERALYNIAVAHKISGNFDKSKSYVEELLSSSSRHIPANLLFLELLLLTNNHDSVPDLIKNLQNLAINDNNVMLQVTGLLVNYRLYSLAKNILVRFDESMMQNKKLLNEVRRYQALIAFHTGMYDESEQYFMMSIKSNSYVAESYHYLGNLFDIRLEYQKAIKAYLSVLQFSPGSMSTRFNLALLYEKTANYFQAFNELIICKDDFETNDPYVSLIRVIAKLGKERVSDVVFKQILVILKNKKLDPLPLAKVTYDNLLKRHEFIACLIRKSRKQGYTFSLKNKDVALLNSCNILNLYLANISNTGFEFEGFIRLLRYNMLRCVIQEKDFDYSIELCSSLAIQCFKSGYVYMVSEDEKKYLDELISSIVDRKLTDDLDVRHVAVLAMYQPVFSLYSSIPDNIEKRSVSPAYGEMINQQYSNILDEIKIKKKLCVDTMIADETSTLVRAMYENNPYPVWDRINVQIPRGINHTINDVSNTFDFRLNNNSLSVLIAGCGTGKHAILNSMRIESSEVLAIDLSLSSLAFAKRMANYYGIDRIEFQQLDILNVSGLGRKFDIIESVGVLHHMEDTYEGLKSLVSVLNKGGLINIGLYSSLGRRHIQAAKLKYHNNESLLTDTDIRDRRNSLIMDDDEDMVKNILSFSEFYKLNECRDLIFHEHEYNFSLTEIKSMLNSLDLEFVGFEFTDMDIKREYQLRFPHDTKLTDLDKWAVFEEEKPDIFSSMYVFWCCKN